MQDADRAGQVGRGLVDGFHIRAHRDDRADRAGARGQLRDPALALLGQVEGLGGRVDRVVAVDQGPAVGLPGAAEGGLEAQGRVGQVDADHDEHALRQHHHRFHGPVAADRAGADQCDAADHGAAAAERSQRRPHVFGDARRLLPEADQSHRNPPHLDRFRGTTLARPAPYAARHGEASACLPPKGGSRATCGVRVAKQHGWGAECATQCCKSGRDTESAQSPSLVERS